MKLFFCWTTLLFLRTQAKILYTVDIGSASLSERIAVLSCQGLMNR